MIHETRNDKAINRLMSHFKQRVILRPPASAADLWALEQLAGALPRDLMIFLATCNGLRVNLQDSDCAYCLWDSREMIRCLENTDGPAIPPGFVPIRGAKDGVRDWVTLELGAAHGSVVRWDPWSGEQYLLATSLSHYLDAWSRFLCEAYRANGKPALKRKLPEFDADYIRRHDPAVVSMRDNPGVTLCLRELNIAATAAADFE